VRPPGEHPVLVWNIEPAAAAAAHSVDPDRWSAAYGAVTDLIAPRFARHEPLRHASSFMLGLLSSLERKNCWTISEARGRETPYAFQHLLSRASWDADAVRDDLRGYVIDAFGEKDGIFVLDETGDLKAGDQSVGVQRQRTGAAGRIENSQVTVCMTYVGRRGHAFIDRSLYLPKSWTEDRERRRDAGIPDEVEFNTKPALAADMLSRAVEAGVPASWVAGDEVYGGNPVLRKRIRELKLGYVLMIACNQHVPTPAGPMPAEECAKLAPKRSWQRLSAGRGSKGERYYDWLWCDLVGEGDDDKGHHWLLVRRNRSTGELAYLRCYNPRRVPLRALIRVAGQRWRIEESFQSVKELAGLDQHQVRKWKSWHRWTTLAMLAHAFLAVATAIERAHAPVPESMIELTVNEFRRLFDALHLHRNPSIETLLAWSAWRRRHQAVARACHYRRHENDQ
jgi:SRSO17 transposase